jgi:hypothetical protein
MAKEVLGLHESHKPLLNAGVTTDFLFAIAEVDEKTGEKIGPALKLWGQPALAICRKIGLKDRVMGRADTEICIDGDYWATAPEAEQRALLDHELHHIQVRIDKRGVIRDDIGRPLVNLRQHDIQIGWFKIVAERNGAHSIERQQAIQIMCDGGQYFWPSLSKLVESNPKLITG